jgi:hypothetical protein
LSTIWAVFGLGALGIAISVGVTLAHRAGGAGEVLPPVIAGPPPARPMLTAPIAQRPVVRMVAPPETKPLRMRQRDTSPRETPARLSVDSDVRANVFIDDQFVQETPLVDHAVPAGKHVVRLESSMAGLRLIPKEETIVLKPGEPRHLTLELK